MVQSERARSSTGLAPSRRQRGSPVLIPRRRLPLCRTQLALHLHQPRRNAAADGTNFPVRRKPSERTGGTMRIAPISPLMEAVPPKFYGGTERIVAYLTDALV